MSLNIKLVLNIKCTRGESIKQDYTNFGFTNFIFLNAESEAIVILNINVDIKFKIY